MKRLFFILVAGMCIVGCGMKVEEDGFAWNKATVYFVLVDRFCNGDSTNDQQYGRRPFADGTHVRNAYSGETGIVQNGQVVLHQASGHVALIERVNG